MKLIKANHRTMLHLCRACGENFKYSQQIWKVSHGSGNPKYYCYSCKPKEY